MIWMKRWVVVACWTWGAASTPSHAEQATNRPTLASAQSAILQVDGPRALAVLAALSPEALSPEERDLRACMLERLDAKIAPPQPKVADPFARGVLKLYRTYWRDAVLEPERRQDIEDALVAALRALLGRPDSTDFEADSRTILRRMKVAGYGAELDRTAQLLELVAWGREDQRIYKVELPDSVQTVRVFLLNDILSYGWARYLNCGSLGTGGWANERGLWAVASQYGDLSGEDFEVNFLAHETQHFADEAYGDLPGWRLEYRAKLVEVFKADRTRKPTLDRFISDQGTDPENPHSHANRRVVRALTQRLGLPDAAGLYTVELRKLRQAALLEFRIDTLALRHEAAVAKRK